MNIRQLIASEANYLYIFDATNTWAFKLLKIVCRLLLFSIILTLALVPSSYSAQVKNYLIGKQGLLTKGVALRGATLPDEPYDPWVWLGDDGGGGSGSGYRRRMSVLLAGDEEAVSTTYSGITYGIIQFYDWEEYARKQLDRGGRHLYNKFGISINVVGAITWDSNDNKDLDELLNEAIGETGFYSGMYFNGQKVQVLIGITNDPTPSTDAGLANPELSAIIIRWQVWWDDDNLVQHEISHLYEYSGSTPHHCISDDCVLSDKWVWILGVNEDGVYWVVMAWVQVADLSNNYCPEHYNTIKSNSARYYA